MPKSPIHFFCKYCDYTTVSRRDYERHIETTKHKTRAKYNNYKNNIVVPITSIKDSQKVYDESGNCYTIYRCVCGKEYNYAGSLSNHKKRCLLAQYAKVCKKKEQEENLKKLQQTGENGFEGNAIIPFSNGPITAPDSIKMEIVKTILAEETHKITTQIQEMKEAFIDSSEKMKTDITTEFKKEIDEVKAQNDVIMKKPAQINNTINIINFLNTECGQAMTLKEFLDNMVLSMDDIYYTRDNGFVKGMSNAFIRQIENIGYNRRPIHCSDKKRLKFFIKTREGIWMRDSDNTNIQEAVSAIKTKHIQKLEEWKSERPGWIHDPIQSDEYLLMCNNFMEDIKVDGDKKKQALIKAIGAATGLKGESEEGNGDGGEGGEGGESAGDIIVTTVMDDGITIKEM